MLKFIRIEEDGDGAVVDEVHLLLRHCRNRLYRSPGRGRNDGWTRTSELFPSYYILHLSGIRMQTGEEVVHSKISEQDEEEGDNTEDMVDDW